jgi:hypothetical protein
MRLIAKTLAALLVVAAPVVWAQPGFFYVFEKADTGEKVCQPFAPDASWTEAAGPFEDSNCEIAIEK